MYALNLLDDRPACLQSDDLHLKSYLDAIEEQVLAHADLWRTQFGIGIFGPPGSGKSSLMQMLAERLKYNAQDNHWLCVRFSLWEYPAEQEPLLGLLTAMSEQHAALARRVEGVLEADWEHLQAGKSVAYRLSLLTQEMRQILVDFVQSGKHLIVILDDLDHVQESKQLINLLEQIKLLLHGKPSLLFLCADENKLVSQLDKHFSNQGRDYLNKFIQLPIELPPYKGKDLLRMLGIDHASTEVQMYFMRIAEMFQQNPRALKNLWNQAILGLNVVKNELARVKAFRHDPSLILMLKWLLLRDCGQLRQNPYHYLKFEHASKNRSSKDLRLLRDDFLRDLGFSTKLDHQNIADLARNRERQLAIFLWHDLPHHCFNSPQVMSLYVRNSREDRSHSRLFIEDQHFMGQTRIEYQDFSWSALSGGYFEGMHFVSCNFSFADLQGAILKNAVFEDCQLRGVRFDGAQLEDCSWVNCASLEELDTDLEAYEIIAHALLESWRENPDNQKDVEPLYKIYKVMVNRGQCDEITRQRLLTQGLRVRAEVLGTDGIEPELETWTKKS